MIKSYYSTAIIVPQQSSEQDIVQLVYPCNSAHDKTNRVCNTDITATTIARRYKKRSPLQPFDMFSCFSPIHLDYKISWASR